MEGTAIQTNQAYPARVMVGPEGSQTLMVTKNQNRQLFQTKASWLVDLFPDVLVVQEKTISVVRNEFLVSYVETMPVRDIGRVVYIDTPLFAGLHILGKNTAHDLHIKGLTKKSALKAKSIIEGLLLDDVGVGEVPNWLDTSGRREVLARVGQDRAVAHYQ